MPSWRGAERQSTFDTFLPQHFWGCCCFLSLVVSFHNFVKPGTCYNLLLTYFVYELLCAETVILFLADWWQDKMGGYVLNAVQFKRKFRSQPRRLKAFRDDPKYSTDCCCYCDRYYRPFHYWTEPVDWWPQPDSSCWTTIGCGSVERRAVVVETSDAIKEGGGGGERNHLSNCSWPNPTRLGVIANQPSRLLPNRSSRMNRGYPTTGKK